MKSRPGEYVSTEGTYLIIGVLAAAVFLAAVVGSVTRAAKNPIIAAKVQAQR